MTPATEEERQKETKFKTNLRHPLRRSYLQIKTERLEVVKPSQPPYDHRVAQSSIKSEEKAPKTKTEPSPVMLSQHKALGTHLIRDLFTFYIRNSHNPIQRGKGSPPDISARKLRGQSGSAGTVAQHHHNQGNQRPKQDHMSHEAGG